MAAGTGACSHPSRLAEDGEHLRMTAECDAVMNRRNTTAFGKLISPPHYHASTILRNKSTAMPVAQLYATPA
jgi:hypothetical protein